MTSVFAFECSRCGHVVEADTLVETTAGVNDHGLVHGAEADFDGELQWTRLRPGVLRLDVEAVR